MADERRNRRYRTAGSVAYQPEYERDNAVRQPARPQRGPEPVRHPRIQPRKKMAPRPTVKVRPQDAVAPFTVVGFAVALACALLLVMSSAQLAVVNNDIVDLQGQLSDLQEEERQLQAAYELVFDLEAIEARFTADGSMVRPGAGQMVYLDVSAEDSVVYYDGAADGLSGLIHRAEDFLTGFLPG